MTSSRRQYGVFQHTIRVILAAAVAAVPSTPAMAQTNAAAMAVQRQVEGLQRPQGEESPRAVPREQPPGPGQPVSSEPPAGMIDTRYVLPSASIVVDLRPALILSSPLGQLLPTELVNAFTGFDPAEMEEVVAFVDTSKAPLLGYGVTFKFKNPIRASSIPVDRRTYVQLAELGGKKYLQSTVPMMYSLYGPNNHTLVAATDPELRQLVDTASRPKTGPMMDRLHEMQASSDLYIAVDVAALRPMLSMLVPQNPANAPPQAKQLLEAAGLISAIELTVNLSNPGPTSLVLQCNDDASTQKLETMIHGLEQKEENANPIVPPGSESPLSQAVKRYMDRLRQPFQPQRNGTSIKFVVDEQSPGQKQLVSSMVVLAASYAATLPVLKRWQHAGVPNQAIQNPGGEAGPGGVPAAPAGDPSK
ncbi:MAG TPA: hypothetical protein VHE81_01540 [Lacipirellulaceae bacterium]|nr:hypothetical protein [Lacipirellulaceae bacterium]